jgi:cell division protein FtsB
VPRALLPLLATVAFVAVLVVGVFPTRSLLAQRAALRATQHQLDVVQQQNAALAAKAKQLQSDTEIERIAREQYNLVRPGEDAYAILPPPAPKASIPDVWPFNGLQQRLDQPK